MTTKYVIELGDDVQFVAKVGVTASGNAYSLCEYKVDLEELNSDYINEHFGELQDEAYQRGFNDGKDSFDHGCDGCRYTSKKSHEEPCLSCTRNHIDQYEPMPKQDDRIEVGDEVVFETEGAESFVVLHKYYDDAGHPSEYRYFVYAQNGEVLIFNEGDGPKKTGRHFQETNKLLEAMRT